MAPGSDDLDPALASAIDGALDEACAQIAPGGTTAGRSAAQVATDIALLRQFRRDFRTKNEVAAQRSPWRKSILLRSFARGLYAAAIVGIPFAVVFYKSPSWGRFGTEPLLSDFSNQVGLLAFLVALAAYLQTVSRDLKAVLAQPRAKKEDTGHWIDFVLVLTAEIAVVLVGIVTALRMSPLPIKSWLTAMGIGEQWTAHQADAAILAAFVACVLFLVVLHFVQWLRAMRLSD